MAPKKSLKEQQEEHHEKVIKELKWYTGILLCDTTAFLAFWNEMNELEKEEKDVDPFVFLVFYGSFITTVCAVVYFLGSVYCYCNNIVYPEVDRKCTQGFLLIATIVVDVVGQVLSILLNKYTYWEKGAKLDLPFWVWLFSTLMETFMKSREMSEMASGECRESCAIDCEPLLA